MGQKKRGHPDVEEVLTRPWCYYCERDFEDLKLLISHQKAKHFKCDRCGRRLNTAGGLSVHMNQVHKETLSQVENALPNRQGLDVEIFGMEGIPADVLDQHRNRIIQNYYQAQEDRRIATGNPAPGQSENNPRKKLKVESSDELKKRLAEHRAKAAAQKAAGSVGGVAAAPANGSPGTFNTPFPPPADGQQFGQPGYPTPTAGAPPYPAQGFPGANFSGLPPRPANNLPSASGLPQRPQYGGGFWNGPGAPPPGYTGSGSAVDDLGASAGQQGDDIDQLIRMAEAGIKLPKKQDPTDGSTEEVQDKKTKKDKDKNSRMIYADTDISPEEKMALLPRYAFVPVA